jgi:FHA domain/Bacterial regulatory proteins, luxR family
MTGRRRAALAKRLERGLHSAWMLTPLSPHASTPAELAERLEFERDGTAFLALRDSAGRQQLIGLADRPRVTIGRREDNDVPLPWDSQTSRLHAIVERAGRHWVVIDDGLSQNGTWIDGVRIGGHRRLRHGDILRIGRTLIAFCDPAAEQVSQTSIGHDLLPLLELTAMQRRVLDTLCTPFVDGAGFATPATNQQIADELHLSVEAVKTHLRTLFRKFAVGDAPQNQKRLKLVEAALRAGIVGERGVHR